MPQVREFGTNYPPSLYDPNELTKDDQYDRIEEARRKWEERQARKPGAPVAFSSGGTIEGAAAAAAAGAAGAAATGEKRKSKWDSSSGGDAAKRPAL